MRKKFLLIISILLVTITTYAYSALSTQLAITSDVKMRPLADIRVNGIVIDSASGATMQYESEYTKNTISSGFILPTTSARISYSVHIDNTGDYDYAIYDLTNTSTNNSGLQVNITSGYTMRDIIPAKTSLDVIVTYTTTTPSANPINVISFFNFKKVYHVSYVTGTSQTIAEQLKYEDVDLVLSNTEPTKNGYTFTKWNTKQDGTGVNYLKGATYTPNESKILYAQYSLTTYNITYELDGGTNNANNPATYTITTNNITLQDATKEGYTFTGWTGNGTTTPTKNLVLAKGSYGDKTYTAHFIDETDPEIAVTNNASTNYLTKELPINVGYGATSASVTVYINATDAASGIKKIEYVYATSTTVPTTGWTETANGKLTLTKNFGTYYLHVRATDNEDNVTTVTTKAIKVRYRVVYYDDYSVSTSASKTAYYYYGESALTTRNPSKTGYTFNGWYSNTTLTTKVVDGNASYTPTTSIKLYGKWTPTNYTIGYTLNGGTVSPANPTSYNIESSPITLTNPTKQGYEFKGWSGTGLTGDENTEVTIATGSTGNRTYTANWTASEISLAGKTLNNATYGTAYTSNAFDQATGGTGSYTYTLSNAPTGATINSTNRTISFPATVVPGTYNTTVTATDDETGKTTTATMTITVAKRNVTLTAGSTSRKYNGQPLTNSTCTAGTGQLVSGHTVTCTMTSGSTVTNVADSPKANTISTYTIKDGNNNDVTSNYNVTTQTGTLTVTKADATCTINSTPTLTYPGATTGNITYTCTGDGTRSVTSSDTTVITVGTVGTTSTPLASNKVGSSTISVSQTAGSNYNATTAKTSIINVTASNFTVTANANGGSISSTTGWTGTGNTATKSVTYNSTYGTLPTISRTGYTLSGWSLLPEGYTQVEYIESTGTQYIDTGVLGSKNIGYDIEIKANAYGGEHGIFAVSSSSSGPHYVLQAHSSYVRLYLTDSNNSAINVGTFQNDSNFHNLKYNVSGGFAMEYDGNVTISSVTNTPDIPYTFTLFARRYGTSVSRNSQIALKYAKIYDSGTLVREFIPCIQNSTGKAGLYDIVNGVFYGNAAASGNDFNTGNAEYLTSESIVRVASNHNIYANWTANTSTVTANANGGTIASTTGWTGTGTSATKSVTYNSTYGTLPTISRTGYTLDGWYKLPNGFTSLEYLNFSGTQYIDTGVLTKQSLMIESEFSTTTASRLFFGARASTSASGIIFGYFASSSSYVGFGGATTQYSTTLNPMNGTKHKVLLSKDVYKIDGTNQTINNRSTLSSFYNIYLGTWNNAGSADTRMYIGKVYNFIVYDGTTLVRYMVPCKNANNVEGLYDFVEQKFYTFGTSAVAYTEDAITSSTTVTETVDHNIYAVWEPNALTFNNKTLNNATYGSSYTSNAFDAATSGTGSYTYTIVSGAPSGATINSTNRTISFTNSTLPATYNVVVRATDNGSGVAKDATMTITVAKRNVTLTAGTASRAWNGSALTNGTCTAGTGQLISGHTVTCAMTDASTITTEGSVANTINTYTIKDGSNNDVTARYNVTTQTGTLTITKATPTVSLSAKSAGYTGQPIAANTATASPDAGGAKTYTYYNGTTCSGTALSGAPTNVGEYSVKAKVAGVATKTNDAYSACTLHTITKVTATLTCSNKEYNGTEQTGCTCSGGTIGGDYKATNHSSTGYTATCTGDDNHSSPASQSWSITKKAVTITAGSDSRAYTATALTKSTCTGNALVSGHSVTCAMTSGSTITNVGSVANTINTYTIKDGSNNNVTANYDVTTATGTLTVTQTTTTTSLSNITKTYNGTNQAASGASAKLANGTAISGAAFTYKYYTNSTCTAGETTTAPKDAGASGANATYYVKAILTGTTNYATSNKCATYTMQSATPTVSLSAKSAAQRIYTGSPIAANSASVTLQNSETYSGTPTYTYYSGTGCSGTALSGAPTTVGEYSVKATTAAFQNYKEGASSCVNHTITQKAPTLTVSSSKALTYPTAATLDYTYDGDGTVSCESTNTTYVTCSVNTSTKKLTLTPVKPTSSAVTVKLKAAAGTNYSAATDQAVSVTVGKGTLTATATAYSGAYDGSVHYAKIKVTKSDWDGKTIVSGETTSYGQSVATNGAYNTDYDLKLGYTDYTNGAKTVYYKITGGTYYNDLTGSTTVTISKRNVTLTAGSTSRAYNGSALTNSTCTAGSGQLLSGHTATCTMTSGSTVTNVADSPVTNTIDTYTIMNGSTDVTANYNVTTATGTLTVTKANATCTINTTPTLLYPGAATGNITYTCTGDGTRSVTSSDTTAITVGTVGTTSTPLTAKKVGSSTITVSQAAGSNYNAATSDTAVVSVGGSTFTATFKYYDGTAIATATSQCTVSTGNTCTVTVPDEVTSSTGQYGSPYTNVSRSTSSLTAGSLALSADTTFYAYYNNPVTIYYPIATVDTTTGAISNTSVGTYSYYRNEYFSSASAMTAVINSTQTATSNFTFTASATGYALRAFANAVNSTSTNHTSVANLAKTDKTTVYAIIRKGITATVYYNSGSGDGTLTLATATTANAYRTMYCGTTTTVKMSNANYSAPAAVSASVGQYGNKYYSLAQATSSMTGNLRTSSTSTSTAADTKYLYAIYQGNDVSGTKTNVTNYYYGSSYTSRTLYRNSYFTSVSGSGAMTTVLATAAGGTANYTTAVGPGSSVWSGLSTAADTTAEYATVQAAANSTDLTLYTVYTLNISYEKGTNVSEIGKTSDSCKITTSDTTCDVELPTITPNTGYSSVGWSTTKDAATGTAAGSAYTISTNATKLYGNVAGNELTFNNQTLSSGTYGTAYTSGAFTGASSGTGSYTYTIVSGAPTGATIDSTNKTISFTATTTPGTYSVVVRATDNGSSNTKDAIMTITIAKRSVTLTAGTTSRAYNGSALTNSTCTAGTGQLATGHTATCTMTSGSTVTNVADSPKTNTISTYTIKDANNNDVTANYTVTTATGTLTLTKATCPTPTGLSIATNKKVSWTNNSIVSSYQISMNASSGFAAHTNNTAYNAITDATGTRTVYLRSVCDTANFTSANSSNASTSTTVYSVSLTAGTGISAVSGAGNYITGASASIDATVKTGYTWRNWTGTSTITTKSTSLTVNGTKTYTANATANSYTVTANANGGSIASTTGWTGTGNTATKSVTYNAAYGTLPTVTGYGTLPTGYTRVDYIESSGTQYIDTSAQIFNKDSHEIVIDFEPTVFYNYNQLFGSTTDGDTFESWIYSTGSLAARYNTVRYGTDNTLTANTRYKVDLIKTGTTLYKYIDNVSYGTGTATTSTATGTLTLFKSGSDYSKFKLYGAKLYANGNLVRDFIPCINDSTGKAGLCDVVNGVFYGNNGTGDFTAGPTITPSSGYTLAGWNGKNLFEKAADQTRTELNNTITISDGTYTLNGNVSDYSSGQRAYNLFDLYNSTNYPLYFRQTSNPNTVTKVLAAGTYTLSVNKISGNTPPQMFKVGVSKYSDGSDIGVITLSNNETSKTFTLSAETEVYFYVTFATNSQVFSNYQFNVQLETGSSATTYEPYYITSDTIVTIPSAHTIYAKWEGIRYYVSFDGNGNTSGTMANQEFKYGQAQNLTSNGYAKSYTVTYAANGGSVSPTAANTTATYTFGGWLMNGEGSIIANGASVNNLTTDADVVIPFEAQWKGDGNVVGATKSITTPTPTRTGATFIGWKLTADDGLAEDEDLPNVIYPAGATIPMESNITLTAQWEDQTAPSAPSATVTSGTLVNGVYKSAVTVKVTAGTDSGTGVLKTTYQLNSGAETQIANNGTFNISTDGTYVITVRTYDKAKDVPNATWVARDANNVTESTITIVVKQLNELNYSFNTMSNLNNWNFYEEEAFDISYDGLEQLNEIRFENQSGWEMIYIPIDTVASKSYKLRFDYLNLQAYTAASGYSGIGIQALTQLTPEGDNTANAIKTEYLPTVVSSGVQTKEFTFTATGTKTYIALNFGMISSNAKIRIGKFRFTEKLAYNASITNSPQFTSAQKKSNGLPAGYTEIDYIESTGTQYINTGVTANSNVEFDITFATADAFSTSGYGCIFGSRVSSLSSDFQLTTYTNTNYQSGTIRYGTNKDSSAFLKGNARTNVKLKNMEYFVDGVKLNTLPITTFSNSNSIYIFALNNANSPTQYGKVKLYSFDISVSGTLTRRFVPAIKDSTGEAGLYDVVGKQFYGNSGTGTFKTSVLPIELPSGYRQVEYIESTGTQYIDTGTKFNSNTDKFEITYQMADKSGNYFICGSGYYDTGYMWLYNYSYSNKLSLYILDTSGTQREFGSLSAVDELKHTIVYEDKKLYTDGNQTANGSSLTLGETPYNFALFTSMNTTGYNSKTKIYSFKMYKSGTLTRDMVPCINEATGKAGMYDLVTNTFYGNAGTGDFVYQEMSDYIFNGWYTEPSGGTILPSPATMPENDITYYAQFDGTKYYNIIYDNNYVTGDMYGQSSVNTSKYLGTGTAVSGKTVAFNTNAKEQLQVELTMGSGSSNGAYFDTTGMQLDANGSYTWSVFLKADSNKTLTIGSQQGGTKTVNVTTEWQRFTYTFTADSSLNKNFIFYLANGSTWTAGEKLYIHSLEIGRITNLYGTVKWNDYNNMDFDSGYMHVGYNTFPTGTIESTFSMDAFPSSGYVDVLANTESGGLEIMVNSSKKIQPTINIGGTYRTYTSTFNASVGVKYTVTGTYDGTTLKYYINGQQVYSLAVSGNISMPSYNTIWMLGAQPLGLGDEGCRLNGKIYSARAYNRALTAEEVQKNYNNANGFSNEGYTTDGLFLNISPEDNIGDQIGKNIGTKQSLAALGSIPQPPATGNLFTNNAVASGVTLTRDGNVYTVVDSGSSAYSGFYIPASGTLVEGHKYLLTYVIQKTSGTLNKIGGYEAGSTTHQFLIDGYNSRNPYNSDWDNVYNDSNMHKVDYVFTWHRDTNYDQIYIQLNRTQSVAVTAKIYNLAIYDITDLDSDALVKDIPVRPGYTFQGWYTQPVGGTQVTSNTIMPSRETTVYAQWVANTTSRDSTQVTFVRNTTAEDNEQTSNTYVTGIGGQTFSTNNWSKTGYSLVGWSTNRNATTAEYAANYAVTDSWITSHKDQTVTLYAVWALDTYTITLNGNGATSNGTGTIYSTYNTAIYLDSAKTKVMTTSANAITKPTRGYTVHYSTSGSSCSDQTVYYTFNGFYTATSGGVQMINSSGYITSNFTPENITQNTTLYAQWTSSSITLPSTSKTGYNFTGWKWNGTTYSAGASFTPTSYSDMDAQWSAKSYRITFYQNAPGAQNSTSTRTLYYGNSLPTIWSSARSTTGATHSFQYWRTSSSGGTKKTKVDGTTKLYAYYGF